MLDRDYIQRGTGRKLRHIGTQREHEWILRDAESGETVFESPKSLDLAPHQAQPRVGERETDISGLLRALDAVNPNHFTQGRALKMLEIDRSDVSAALWHDDMRRFVTLRGWEHQGDADAALSMRREPAGLRPEKERRVFHDSGGQCAGCEKKRSGFEAPKRVWISRGDLALDKPVAEATAAEIEKAADAVRAGRLLTLDEAVAREVSAKDGARAAESDDAARNTPRPETIPQTAAPGADGGRPADPEPRKSRMMEWVTGLWNNARRGR